MKFRVIAVALAAFTLLLSGNDAFAKKKKPVMGVIEFKNSTTASWWRSGVGRDLANMLTNEMGSSGKFKMVERQKLQSVIKEQDLGTSGRVRKGTAAKAGKLTGAQYLVTGTVSAYEEDTSSQGGGISVMGVSIGGGSNKAYIAIDIRVVNTTTGDISYFRTVEANSSGGGLRIGLNIGGIGANFGGKKKTPAGKAIRACIIEITEYLECVMVDKGSCIKEYKKKEEKRRKKTKSSISLDE